MTTGTLQIAAERQRERIPTRYLVDFDGITNAELASMCDHDALPTDWRVFCGWELEYREAFGINVYYDAESDTMKRRR